MNGGCKAEIYSRQFGTLDRGNDILEIIKPAFLSRKSIKITYCPLACNVQFKGFTLRTFMNSEFTDVYF